MTTSLVSRPVYQFAVDVALGFGFFVLVTIGLAGTAKLTHLASNAAHAGSLVRAANSAVAVSRPSVVQPAAVLRAEPVNAGRTSVAHFRSFGILSGVFALMFALNLAFFRHIRRVYANPRARARV